MKVRFSILSILIISFLSLASCGGGASNPSASEGQQDGSSEEISGSGENDVSEGAGTSVSEGESEGNDSSVYDEGQSDSPDNEDNDTAEEGEGEGSSVDSGGSSVDSGGSSVDSGGSSVDNGGDSASIDVASGGIPEEDADRLDYSTVSDPDVLTEFVVKEVAQTGSDSYPITVVFPLEYGQYDNTDSFYIADEKGNPVSAQFHILNRWWAKDNSVRHIMAHFVPDVSAYESGQYKSGRALYTLRSNVINKNTQPQNPVVTTDNGGIIGIDNGLIEINIQKSPLKITTPGGELKSLFYKEDGALDESFDRDEINFEIEEDGPLRTVVKISSQTIYNSPTDIEHGWALRIYAYADSEFVKVDFQLQNSALVEYSAPLYFKGHELRLEANETVVPTKLRAEEPPEYDVTLLPLGFIDGNKVNVFLRNFQQTFPNGLEVDNSGNVDIEMWPLWKRQFHDIAYVDESIDLYWLDDMQHIYKEVMLDFSESRTVADVEKLAETFQFPPVAVVPAKYFAETKVTVDMGVIPQWSVDYDEIPESRKPVYEDSKYDLTDWSELGKENKYQFGISNFAIDVYRKKYTATTGGEPYTGYKFYVTKNTADYYDSVNLAKGELNVRPQWLAGYNHERDYENLQPSTKPYAGESWRRHIQNGLPVRTREYIEGTSQTARPRDDQHGWFYHMEDVYFMTGDKWLYDWFKFMSEFKKTYLQHCSDGSNRGVGHSLAVTMSSYRVTGDQELIELVPAFLENPVYSQVDVSGSLHGTRGAFKSDGVWKAAGFQLGFLMRALIDYYEETGEQDSVLFDFIGDQAKWICRYSQYGYYYDVATTEKSSGSAGSSLSAVDPVIWYAVHAEEDGEDVADLFDVTDQFVNEGIGSSSGRSYFHFDTWDGFYAGSYYLHFLENDE